MTFEEIDTLQHRIETLFMDQWEGMPESKPTYTEWFYSDGGPRDAIDTLLNKMRDAVIQKTYVPGCIRSKNQFFRPIQVCERCKDKDSCAPYMETKERLDEVAA